MDGLTAAFGLLLELVAQAQKVSLVIQAAHDQDRDITPAEWLELRTESDNARARLEAAIAAAEARENAT